MAFKPYQSDIMSTTPFVYLPTTAEEVYVAGEVVKLASGALTKASGTDVPTYVVQEAATGAAGKKIAVYRIPSTMVFEVPLAAAGTALNIGDKVTIHTTGTDVTATTTGGVFEIVDINGTAVGDTVCVRLG